MLVTAEIDKFAASESFSFDRVELQQLRYWNSSFAFYGAFSSELIPNRTLNTLFGGIGHNVC